MAGRVLIKIAYLLVRRILGLAALLFRRDMAKDAELLVLRHENAVPRRQVGRLRYEPADRVWFAALARLIPRRRWTDIFPVTPATLLTWHRKLAASRYDTSNRRKPGRPPTVPGVARLVVRLAKENPLWGYRRFHGELTKLSVAVAPSTVWKIPHAAGIDPAPRRTGPSWRQFLQVQAAGIVAVDFLHADTVLMKNCTSWYLSSTAPAGCTWAASPRTLRASGRCSRPATWLRGSASGSRTSSSCSATADRTSPPRSTPSSRPPAPGSCAAPSRHRA